MSADRTIGPALLLLLALVTGSGCWVRRPPETRAALAAREVAGRKLAEQIAAEANPEKVVVLANPFTQQAGRPENVYAFERAALQGMRAAFGGAELTVYWPQLRPGVIDNPQLAPVPPKTTTPLSFLVEPDTVDQLRGQHPGVEIVVSLIGVPYGIEQTRAWQAPDGPRFGFLFPDWRVLGNPQQVRAAFESGKIIAAVLWRPGASEASRLTGDLDRDFDERFILVTPANVDELWRQYPGLF